MPTLFATLMLLPGLWGTYAGSRWLLSQWYIGLPDQVALSCLAALVYFMGMIVATTSQRKEKLPTKT
jgi:hypothetical protein